MKKFFVLTSLLALAACGGGSGGANPETGIRVPDAAIASNKNVTSMASEILVAKNGGSPDIVRSSTIMRDGKEYTAYHLDDAKFFTNETTDEFLSFGIDDNGQINKLVWHEIQEVNGQHVEETEEINRDGPDTNVFTENVQKYKVYANNRWYYTDSLIPREYSKQEIKNAFRRAYNDGEITDSVFAEIDAYIDATDMTPINYVHHNVIDLHGKTLPENHKLRYSDFGYATILANENNQPGDGEGDDSAPIFGGYEVKEIQNTENLHDLTFTGKAVAALGNDHQNGVQKIETNNDATTLVVDANGKQTLTMPFNDYYTIMVEKPRNGDSTISWTGDTTIGYQLDSGQNVGNQRVNIKYYGDNSVPSEVVGGVEFQNNNVEFNGAFGATAN